MKQLIFRCFRFFRSSDGPTAMESAIFFGLTVILCIVSMKMAATNLAAQPLFTR